MPKDKDTKYNTQLPTTPSPVAMSNSMESRWYRRKGLLIIFVVVFVTLVLIMVNHEIRNKQVVITTSSVNATNLEFVIEGTKIYQIVDHDKQLLFTNVENISAVHLGPDGNTIHFKFIDSSAKQAHCANLASKVILEVSDYSNPPPNKAPWDYKRIGHFATIEECGEDGRSGGYVPDTNYFTYLKVDPLGTAHFFVEDLSTGRVKNFLIDYQNLVLAHIVNTSKWKDFIRADLRDDEGSTYYYPQASLFVANGKLLAAIGRMVITVDLIKNNLLGIELLIDPKYSIIENSFWFHSNGNSPLILMASGWDGGENFKAVFDLSGDSLQVMALDPGYYRPADFETPFYEWYKQKLLLHSYKVMSVTDQVSKQDLVYFENTNITSEQKNNKNNEVKIKLMATGKYVGVNCLLPSGEDLGQAGCIAITKGVEYQVIPGRGLLILK